MRIQLIGALVLAFMPTFVFARQPDPLPVQDFFSYPKISGAEISPDGQYLAMAVANDKTGADRNILAIIRTDDHKLQSSFWLKNQQQVLDFWWANDERVLVSTATLTGSLDAPEPDGELYAVNVDGSKQMQLLPNIKDVNAATHATTQRTVIYFARMLDRLAQDPDNILVAAAPRDYDQLPQAWKLNIYTGAVHKVAQGGAINGDLIADQNGVVRLATGTTTSGEAKIYYRPNGDTVDWKDISAL